VLVAPAYRPSTIKITVGTEVIWTNANCPGCTVTFPGLGLDSGHMVNRATFKHTFTSVGTFMYHCLKNPEMVGTVNVTT
jgi:plastocyanin